MRLVTNVLLGLLLRVVSSQDANRSFCPPTYVDCRCGNGTAVQIRLPTIYTMDRQLGIPRCVAAVNPLSVCERQNCIIIPNANFEILFQKGRTISLSSNHLEEDYDDSPRERLAHGRRQNVEDPSIMNIYPVQVIFPRPASAEDAHRRVERDAYRRSSACRVPELRNSEMICWKWPDWQTCKQTCIYGHGIEEGSRTVKERTYTCRLSLNKWEPGKVTDCEPYINCKLRLRSPGDLNCVEPTDAAPYCDVTCTDYEDYHSPGNQRFTCDEKTMLSSKKPQLPNCVYLEEDDEVRLVKPPAL